MGKPNRASLLAIDCMQINKISLSTRTFDLVLSINNNTEHSVLRTD